MLLKRIKTTHNNSHIHYTYIYFIHNHFHKHFYNIKLIKCHNRTNLICDVGLSWDIFLLFPYMNFAIFVTVFITSLSVVAIKIYLYFPPILTISCINLHWKLCIWVSKLFTSLHIGHGWGSLPPLKFSQILPFWFWI